MLEWIDQVLIKIRISIITNFIESDKIDKLGNSIELRC